VITHIVLFKPNPMTDLAAVERLRHALAGLVGVIPGLSSFTWGANVSPEGKSQGYELGFVMTFDGKADCDAYLPHPDHIAVRPLVQAVATETLVFDLET
jgi:hypothetical protein